MELIQTTFSSSTPFFLVFLALFFSVLPRYAAETPCYLAKKKAAPVATSSYPLVASAKL